MQAPAMEREVVEQQLKERFGDIPGAAQEGQGAGRLIPDSAGCGADHVPPG